MTRTAVFQVNTTDKYTIWPQATQYGEKRCIADRNIAPAAGTGSVRERRALKASSGVLS